MGWDLVYDVVHVAAGVADGDLGLWVCLEYALDGGVVF